MKMKNYSMINRINAIEEALQGENVTPLVAIKTDQGIEWNGATYSDEESLAAAVKAVCGSHPQKRLVTITLQGGGSPGMV